MTEYEKQQNIAISQKKFDEAMAQYKANYGSQLRSLQSALQKETDPERRSGIESSIAEIQEKLTIANSLTMYDVEGAEPDVNRWTNIGMDASNSVDDWLKAIEKTINNRMTKTVTVHANSSAAMQNTGGLGTGGTVTTTKKVKPTTKLEEIQEPSEPEPTPTPQAKPAATAGGGQTGRVTAAMKPAEFKPKYLEEIEPKSEEEYLGKDPNNWKTMSKAEKAAKAIGFIGDIGGDVIDTIAAGYGLENGGAKRLREAREKLQRDKEERQAQYRDYVNKIEAENRRIREFNAGIGNQLAFQQFQAENEYQRQRSLMNEQARLQRENGLYNTPL